MTLFTLQNQPFILTAVTRRGRADTLRRQAYMKECLAMEKVFPGYPQQPFLTLDMRVHF